MHVHHAAHSIRVTCLYALYNHVSLNHSRLHENMYSFFFEPFQIGINFRWLFDPNQLLIHFMLLFSNFLDRLKNIAEL